MQSWDDARVFLAVIRKGSFTAAARALDLNQSTVSRKIADLESELGQPLFSRSRRSLQATELAERLRSPAERVERAMAGLDRAAAETDRPEGVVRVATAEELTSGLLVPAFGQLRRAHPDIQIELIGGSRVVDLERGDADLALRVVQPTRGDLVSRKVASFEFRPYASRAFIKRSRGAPLEALDWLALDDPQGRMPEARWVDEVVGERRPVLRTNNTLDLALAASEGLGAALLPNALAQRHKNLVPLDAKVVLRRDLWLVAPRALARVARVRAVMAWIMKACGHRPTGRV